MTDRPPRALFCGDCGAHVRIELGGVAEVAEWTGLKPDTITKYRSLGKFPEPDWTTARQDLWNRRTIEMWKETKR